MRNFSNGKLPLTSTRPGTVFQSRKMITRLVGYKLNLYQWLDKKCLSLDQGQWHWHWSFDVGSLFCGKAVLFHFSGDSCQLVNEYGSLAAGADWAAWPFAEKFLLPASKSMREELFDHSVPEVEVDTKRKCKQPNQLSVIPINKQVGWPAVRKAIRCNRRHREVGSVSFEEWKSYFICYRLRHHSPLEILARPHQGINFYISIEKEISSLYVLNCFTLALEMKTWLKC